MSKRNSQNPQKVTISARVHPSLAKYIRTHAKAYGWSMSEFIEVLLSMNMVYDIAISNKIEGKPLCEGEKLALAIFSDRGQQSMIEDGRKLMLEKPSRQTPKMLK